MHIPLVSFFLLFILAIPFESGFTIQSLTGWNMVIPSTSYLEITVLIIISIITFIYWRLLKNKSEIDFKLFVLHYLLTIPIVLWARFNYPIRGFTANNSTDIFEMIDLLNRILYTVLVLFVIGQISFAYLLFKIRSKNKSLTFKQ